MQPLPKGVTGFDPPEVGVDVRRFTSACHAAARQVAGRVLQVSPAHVTVTSSFYQASVTVRTRPDTLRVLCNAYYPIVAFASPAAFEGDMNLDFVDCAELADLLRDEFTILTRQDACANLAPELIASLSETELDQMRHWQAQRIGDLIFNYWD